jgi:Tol biopolymer transport system component
MGVAYSKKTVPQAKTLRSAILPPADNQFPGLNIAFLPALSPDGRQIVAPVRDSHGKSALWLRSLNDAEEGRILPGTEGGSQPFWSPDSHSIGFFAASKLKRIDLEGNLVQVLADVTTEPRGGAWSPDGTILFTPTTTAALYQIRASGGTPRQVTDLGKTEQSHRWPVFLADGKHFIFFVRNPQQPELTGIYAGSLDSKEYHLVVNTTVGPAFPVGEKIVYVRNGVLITQGFDEQKLVASGEPVALPDHVAVQPLNAGALFNVSPSGELVYYPGPLSMALTWYERNGKPDDTLDTAANIGDISLSPDGTRVVASIYNPGGLSTDLWNFDLNRRGSKTRLTSGPETKRTPVWEPDGQFVLFSSGFEGGSRHIGRVRSDGTGVVATILSSDGSLLPRSVCRDGRYLAFNRVSGDSRTSSISILPLTGDRKPFALVQSQYAIGSGRFSPDCKWVAYISAENGQQDVYVTHFPDAAHKIPVSTQGGINPRWRSDGKELFYFSIPQSSMMAVDVDEKADGISFGNPRKLFPLVDISYDIPFYDVTSDGQRFMILTSSQSSGTASLRIVTNWEAELKKK